MKVLILGGTRFFGKRLVSLAVQAGWAVTVVTRGQTPTALPENVEHVCVDRHHKESMRFAFGNRSFDIVYDQICFSPDDARIACEIFHGEIGRYIFTSSASVYEPQMLPIKEKQFDPRQLPIRYGGMDDFTYREGKRYAEAVFFQQATFPVTAVRFPIVIAADDYTGRFRFHVERVLHGKPIGIPGKPAKMSFISADEAAAFLHWAGTAELHGPVNAGSHFPLTALEMVEMIACEVGKKPVVTADEREGVRSPYFTPQNFTLNMLRAFRNGYRFSKSKEWLPGVIRRVWKESGT